MKRYDVIFVGGGVMGCAIAYHLLKIDPHLKLAIIEKDPTYAKSSTVLSDGNMRVQFNIRENILMWQYGYQMVKNFHEEMAIGDEQPNISFHEEGNLFLVDEGGQETALQGMKLQQSLGGEVEWWDADEVHQHYPFIDPQTVAGGTFGAQDGTMDPQAVLLGYKNKSIHFGAEYIVGEVISIDIENHQVQGVRLANGDIFHALIVVNSAGAWSVKLARDIGIELPVEPVMRHVFHVETKVNNTTRLPLIVFPNGLYIHHEHANHFLVGKSMPVDKKGFDFTFHREYFSEYMWEHLVHYMPEFEQLKLIDGWTGLYAVNTLDGNAIIGEAPQVKGCFIVTGFSGHGFQQCHAIGLYLSEIILRQKPTIDLSIFSPERILNNQPVQENPHKLV